jgi:hypothetical protein
MSGPREWGVGSGGSEPKASSGAPTPDTHSRLPRNYDASVAKSEARPDGGAPTPHTPLPTPHDPNWRLIYSAVLIELALLILIFYAFTKAFA